MKSGIHPNYFVDVEVVCSCGKSFVTGSTKQSIRVEVCHMCHPLYTGEKRFVDSKGQVGRFQEKQQIAEKFRALQSQKTKKIAQKKQEDSQSLRDLLGNI